MKKRSLLNIFLLIALVNFVCSLLLIFSNGVSAILKIASFLFFVNFVLNMVLATKRSKGEI
ncbi:hypothetical protein P6Y11_05990 [Enterococcus faecalis]|uniref:hypothetical protein n=1 Tax=Enterococcus faecalis TaxID=1351 RepID=UPI0009CBF801|nr:hypothetical protein [Enterococcus faecalis]MDG0920287.1 hypothetical protein [Enterococcus faecalis]OOL77600.1 hypothetical protein B1P85_09950 [Enterococcus faecalis]